VKESILHLSKFLVNIRQQLCNLVCEVVHAISSLETLGTCRAKGLYGSHDKLNVLHRDLTNVKRPVARIPQDIGRQQFNNRTPWSRDIKPPLTVKHNIKQPIMPISAPDQKERVRARPLDTLSGNCAIGANLAASNHFHSYDLALAKQEALMALMPNRRRYRWHDLTEPICF